MVTYFIQLSIIRIYTGEGMGGRGERGFRGVIVERGMADLVKIQILEERCVLEDAGWSAERCQWEEKDRRGYCVWRTVLRVWI